MEKRSYELKVSWWHKFLVSTLKNNPLIYITYNAYYRKKNSAAFWQEIKKRENLSIFDIDGLSQDIPFCPIEKVKDSNYYGHAAAIKKYAGVNKFPFALEHGLYYGNLVTPGERYRMTKRIMTFSEERKKVLNAAINKPVVAIGPYIHYAEPYLTVGEYNEIKKKYGKILLFMPSHSVIDAKDMVMGFKADDIIQKVKSFANEHGFDSVFVNLYFKDVMETNYAEQYKKAGFIVTTAGHRFDLLFINRVRSIIELCDYVIGNSLGTNLGYCIYLNKPFCIIDNDLVENIDQEQIPYIGRFFYDYTDHITEEQYEVVSKYWGFDCIKSKEEMASILNENN